MNYLLRQTGQPLQELEPDAEDVQQALEEVEVEEPANEEFLAEDLTLCGLTEVSGLHLFRNYFPYPG